jgi:hypothetical protein
MRLLTSDLPVSSPLKAIHWPSGERMAHSTLYCCGNNSRGWSRSSSGSIPTFWPALTRSEYRRARPSREKNHASTELSLANRVSSQDRQDSGLRACEREGGSSLRRRRWRRSAHDGRWHQSRLVQEALVEQCPIKRCCQATSGLKHSRWQKSEIHPLLKHIARERLASPALDNKHGLVVDTIRFTSLR